MLRLKNLTVKNFLSVGNVTQAVNLADNGLTLVLGHNADGSDGVRNGTGKSTILQAITYALYGKPLTKIKLPNLVNNINGKGMLVTLEFEHGGTTYRIERGKKPDVMKFYVEGEEQHYDDETQGENRQTQIAIERSIGMSLKLFKHTVALNTFTDPFLKESAGEQRAVIEELFGITEISQRAEALKTLRDDTKEEIRDLKALVEATTEANTRIEATIKNAEDSSRHWDEARDAKVSGLNAELSKMEAIDFDAELALLVSAQEYDETLDRLEREVTSAQRDAEYANKKARDAEAEIANIEAALANDAAGDYSRLDAEKLRKLGEADRIRDKISKRKTDLEQARADLDNADASNCVCCDQPITGTEHLATIKEKLARTVAQVEEDIARMGEEVEARTKEAADVDVEIEQAKSEADIKRQAYMDALGEAKIELAPLLKDAETAAAKMEEFVTQLTQLGDRPKPSFSDRDALYRARSERDTIERAIENEMAATNPYHAQIRDLKSALQVIDMEPLESATDLHKHQDFLFKLLTSKDSFIRKKIIDQNLAYLNSRFNHYLDKMGLPHEVVFQSDLSVEISLLGRDYDFAQLSRGEMNRVIMATSWSFRDVWESRCEAINLCFVDELLDNGLCPNGVESALGILKQMVRDRAKNIFLISHREELQARIDQTLHVRKENAFTTFDVS